MIKNDLSKGIFLVALGATSYGMLATVVKLAYTDNEKFTTSEITLSQFFYGIIGILIIMSLPKKEKNKSLSLNKQNIFQLILAGTSLGLTSVFYYLSVKYIDVSIAIVLLMQTVWMGVFLEWILDRKNPSKRKIISVIIVLIGTLLATNILNKNVKIDWQGIFWGILAAGSFTTTMFTANKIAPEGDPSKRSFFMLIGGAIIVIIFSFLTQKETFNFAILGKYGIFLALFGTIIPPILMNKGFPKTGIGVGSIVSSLELPISVCMAHIFLNEKVTTSQWIGILLILSAIIIMNFTSLKFKK